MRRTSATEFFHIHWLFLTFSSLITFGLLLVLVRWIGSTQLTQLTFFNWVAGASMGNIAANMMSTANPAQWLSSCFSLIVFTAGTVVAAFISLKSRQFRRVANGEPVVLIHKGVILRHNLRRTKVNLDILVMMLREKGYFSYGEIEFAILEPTGSLSILPAQSAQSISKADLVKGPDLSPTGQGPYVEIVIDGEVDEDKLVQTGRSRAWLDQTLCDIGGASLADVMYLAVNAEGEVTVDLHRRDRSPPPRLL